MRRKSLHLRDSCKFTVRSSQQNLGDRALRSRERTLARICELRTLNYEPLFIVVASESEGDGSPEEAGAHLHGKMAVVIGVPDPDIAPILDDTRIGGGLDADGLESAESGLDLFAALHLHGHR